MRFLTARLVEETLLPSGQKAVAAPNPAAVAQQQQQQQAVGAEPSGLMTQGTSFPCSIRHDSCEEAVEHISPVQIPERNWCLLNKQLFHITRCNYKKLPVCLCLDVLVCCYEQDMELPNPKGHFLVQNPRMLQAAQGQQKNTPIMVTPQGAPEWLELSEMWMDCMDWIKVIGVFPHPKKRLSVRMLDNRMSLCVWYFWALILSHWRIAFQPVADVYLAEGC